MGGTASRSGLLRPLTSTGLRHLSMWNRDRAPWMAVHMVKPAATTLGSVGVAPVDDIQSLNAQVYSIPNRVEQGRRVLFLPCQADQIAGLRSVIST